MKGQGVARLGGLLRRYGPYPIAQGACGVAARPSAKQVRMKFGNHSFEELIWGNPSGVVVDWLEIASLLTPRSAEDTSCQTLPDGRISMASGLAAKRLLVLCYAHGVRARVVEVHGTGQHPVACHDAFIDSRQADQVRPMLRAAARRLASGAAFLDGAPDPAAASAALWRATLLCNGLVIGPPDQFAIRVPQRARAVALQRAAEVLQVRISSTRRRDGVRVSLDRAEAVALLDELLDRTTLSDAVRRARITNRIPLSNSRHTHLTAYASGSGRAGPTTI